MKLMAIRHSLFLKIIMCLFIFCNAVRKISAEGDDFNELMKSVDSFIRDSQKVISQLNYEIVRSNDTLDRIALDSQKMNLLSGKEEKEIDDLENQLGNGMVVFRNIAELHENESPTPSYSLGSQSGNKMNNVRRLFWSKATEKPCINSISAKYVDGEPGNMAAEDFLSSLIKRQNKEPNSDFNVSSAEVKVVGSSENGSTVCIIVRPYFCDGATEAMSTRPTVTGVNFDPAFVPPVMSALISSTTQKNKNSQASGSEGTPINSVGSEVNSSSYLQNVSIPLNNEPILLSILNLSDLKNISTVSSVETLPQESIAESYTTANPVVEPFSLNSEIHSSKIAPIFRIEAAGPLTTSAPLLPNILGIVNIQPNSEGNANTKENIQHKSTSWGLASTSAKPTKHRNKLFGKNKKYSSHKYGTTTIAPSNSEGTNTSQVYVATAPLNGSSLLLMYTLHKGDKNNTLTYNIESISIIRNNSIIPLQPTAIYNNKSSVELNDNKKIVNSMLDIFNSKTDHKLVPDQNSAMIPLNSTNPNTVSERHTQESMVNIHGIYSKPMNGKQSEFFSLSTKPALNTYNGNAFSDLVMLIEYIKDIYQKKASNTEHHSESNGSEPHKEIYHSMVSSNTKTPEIKNIFNTYSVKSGTMNNVLEEKNIHNLKHNLSPFVDLLEVPFSESLLSHPILSQILQKPLIFNSSGPKMAKHSSPNVSSFRDVTSSIQQREDLSHVDHTARTSISAIKNDNHNKLGETIFLNKPLSLEKLDHPFTDSKDNQTKLYIKSALHEKSNGDQKKTPLEVYIVDPKPSFLKQGLKIILNGSQIY